MAFRGTFEFTLDAKNRLTVPSKFRAAFADGAVLACGLENCGALWRPADFERYTAEARAGMHTLSPEYRQLTRFFSNNAWDVDLDGAGRVILTSTLIEWARLGKEVVVAGSDDCLEIWDRDRHREMNAQTLSELPDLTARFGHTA